MSTDRDLSSSSSGGSVRAKFGPWLIPVAAWIVYGLLYEPFHARFGIQAGLLTLVPVLLTAWQGAWPGLAAGLLVLPATALLDAAYGHGAFLSAVTPGVLLGAAALIAVGGVVGRNRDLERRRRAEVAERQRVERGLKERELRLAVSSDLARALRDGRPADRTIQAAVETLHRYFPGLRAAYSVVKPDGSVTVVHAAGPPRPEAAPLVLPSEVIEGLPAREVIAVDDTRTGIAHQTLSAGLIAGGVGALLDAPVHYSDTLVGLLSLDASAPHVWSAHERATVREAADLLGVALRDVDARRQLEDSERKFRLVAESSQAMIILTQDDRPVYFNPQAERLTGYTVEELSPDDLEELFHPADRQRVLSYQRRRAAGLEAPTHYEARIVRRTGDTRWMDVRASVFELAGRRTILTTALDITDRKLAEQELRAGEARLRAVMEHLQDGVFLSVDGRIVYANQGLARVMGCGVTELLGREAIEHLVPRDRSRAVSRLAAAAVGDAGEPIEYEVQRADGTIVPVLASSRRLEVDGRAAVLSVVRDISEQRQLEERLRQTQRLESVGQLAGGVAHNFNNALAAIMGYAELTLRVLPAGHPGAEDVRHILTVADHAASLTQQLLTFSRKERITPTAFSLTEAIEATASLIGPLLGDDVRLELNLDPTLGRVVADRGQIEQVVANLAINGRDAMADGGVLTIETAEEVVSDGDARRYPDARSGAFARLRVRDTGSGMDQETVARVFEPFFTTKEPGQGVGLGLSTVHGAVKQSGGFVTVESTVGGGTVFSLYLPFERSGDADPAPPEPSVAR